MRGMRLPARVAGIQKQIHTPKHLYMYTILLGVWVTGFENRFITQNTYILCHNAIQGMLGMRGMHL